MGLEDLSLKLVHTVLDLENVYVRVDFPSCPAAHSFFFFFFFPFSILSSGQLLSCCGWKAKTRLRRWGKTFLLGFGHEMKELLS